jgi:hypothetical protein
MKRLILTLSFAAMLLAAFAATQSTPQNAPAGRWYKGNLHTHTLNSDGDSTPFEVATWYREHGYQFLILTDHNYLTGIAGLNATLGAAEKFLLIPGEVISGTFDKKPYHVHGFNLGEVLLPRKAGSMAESIQNDITDIRQARGLPSLNHPNFHWAVSVEDMLAVSGLTHFEIYNGHPEVNNEGGGGAASLDQMWDALLTAGRKVHGIAVDDAHHFKRIGKTFSNPGQGWVWVRTDSLTTESIMRALENGDFYASTGVKLKDLQADGGELALEIDRADWEKTTTFFIGAGGKILATSFEKNPRYRLGAGEAYVRARVDSSTGMRAWTQAVFAR